MGIFSRSRSPKQDSPPPSAPETSATTGNAAAAANADPTAATAATNTGAPSPQLSRPFRLLSRLSSSSLSSAFSPGSSTHSFPSPASYSNAMPRTLADFHVRPDKPHHTYAAGDYVRGAVVLAVVKPVRITHLVVSLHGFVRVFRSAADGTKAKGGPVPAPAGMVRRAQYHGNGTASIFQDEQVLSGEGRLEPGRYEFGFNLKFPDRALPSSVDFERGTISYVVTATLTRPTSIKPTTTCDRLVRLEENLDIGALPLPRPRTIFLEPISKLPKTRRPPGGSSAKSPKSFELPDTASISDRDAAEPREPGCGPERGTPELTDTRSVVSGGSLRSGSTLSRRGSDSVRVSTPVMPPSVHEMDSKTITATVELLRGGSLPGEMVPVRVSVQHVKPVKSMHGIIVTLYREARINPSPSEALFAGNGSSSDIAGSGPPRRRTLGSLSRTSSSTRAVSFRKDLSQAVGPLLIDPETLRTSVTINVRVPEACFPTIKRVPGDMISFRYQVEVIADLGGRLANQFQTAQQSSRVDTFMNSSQSNDMKVFNSWGGTIINTTSISRERGIVVVNLELVVGTVNSAKQLRKHKATALQRTAVSVTSCQEEEEEEEDGDHLVASEIRARQPDTSPLPDPLPHSRPPPLPFLHPPPPPPPPPPAAPVPAPTYVPPPEITDETALTEKERMRRAEERLLPSQPPSGPSGPATAAAEAGPSALPQDIASAPPPEAVPDLGLALPDFHPGPSTETPVPSGGVGPSAPLPEPSGQNCGGGGSGGGTEDKQEVERRRLLAEASAPPEMPEDAADGQGPVAATAPGDEAEADVPPSAPTLDDEGGYGAQYAFRPAQEEAEGAEPPPRYER